MSCKFRQNANKRHQPKTPSGRFKARADSKIDTHAHEGSFSPLTVMVTKTLKINILSPTWIYHRVVPPVKLSTYGPRSFAVAGPTTWNSLPEYLSDPELSIDSFGRQFRTFLFAQY